MQGIFGDSKLNIKESIKNLIDDTTLKLKNIKEEMESKKEQIHADYIKSLENLQNTCTHTRINYTNEYNYHRGEKYVTKTCLDCNKYLGRE